MIRRLVARGPGLAVGGGDIGFAPDDGLKAKVLGGRVEIDSAVEVAVIGYGYAFHTQGPGPLHQGLDAA